MPMYDYECLKCGEEFEAYAPVENRKQTRCPECRGKSRILIYKVQAVTFVPYYSHALGAYIGSRREKQRIMQEKGLEETTGMSFEEVQREADRCKAQREKVLSERPVPDEFLETLQKWEAENPDPQPTSTDADTSSLTSL